MFSTPAHWHKRIRTHRWRAAFVGFPGAGLLATVPFVPAPAVCALGVVGGLFVLAALPFLLAARRARRELDGARQRQMIRREVRYAQLGAQAAMLRSFLRPQPQTRARAA